MLALISSFFDIIHLKNSIVHLYWFINEIVQRIFHDDENYHYQNRVNEEYHFHHHNQFPKENILIIIIYVHVHQNV